MSSGLQKNGVGIPNDTDTDKNRIESILLCQDNIQL